MGILSSFSFFSYFSEFEFNICLFIAFERSVRIIAENSFLTMQIFQKSMRFFNRFQSERPCCYLLIPSFFFCQSTIQLPYLPNLSLIDIFFAEFWCNSFRICNTSIKVELFPYIKQRIDIFSLFFEVSILILIFSDHWGHFWSGT